MDSLMGASSPANIATTRPSSTPFPGREDCWSEDATFTLIDAWGERHLELNRGNLRQKHWQEVADAVNDRHGHVKKSRRTDVQCKNRIDTLKKKYKIEKAKVSESDGTYTSPWPFFTRLDALIGDTFPLKKHSSPVAGDRRSTPPAKSPMWITPHVPVAPRSGTQKRPLALSSPAYRDNSYFRGNFSAFAAAAAAAAESEGVDSDGSDGSRSSTASGSRKKGRGGDGGEEERNGDRDKCSEYGYRELAQAIERFGELYERVEAAKQRQMIELEKQRMQFAKDLEYQRMQLFMETQVQLEKIKRAKRSSRTGEYSEQIAVNFWKEAKQEVEESG